MNKLQKEWLKTHKPSVTFEQPPTKTQAEVEESIKVHSNLSHIRSTQSWPTATTERINFTGSTCDYTMFDYGDD